MTHREIQKDVRAVEVLPGFEPGSPEGTPELDIRIWSDNQLHYRTRNCGTWEYKYIIYHIKFSRSQSHLPVQSDGKIAYLTHDQLGNEFSQRLPRDS